MKAPVTYDPSFVGRGADTLFDFMWRYLPWEQREGAPRRECWFNPYGQPYTYGTGEFARTYQAHPWAQMIDQIAEILNGTYFAAFDCCFVNGYEHGRQHLGWHADDSPEMDLDHPIAIVSLGAPREIWFRPTGDKSGENVDKLLLGSGSVALMSAGMQREWQHRIPKSSVADCGPRLSLTYRRLVR
jgi:alkylated DNA repair dioxygenase AlkB